MSYTFIFYGSMLDKKLGVKAVEAQIRVIKNLSYLERYTDVKSWRYILLLKSLHDLNVKKCMSNDSALFACMFVDAPMFKSPRTMTKS